MSRGCPVGGPVDDVHGAHAVYRASSLDEEDPEQEVWLDDDCPYQPPCYRQSGWYTVEAIQDCAINGSGDVSHDGDHPAGADCTAKILWFADPDTEGEAWPVHVPLDAQFTISYNRR